MKTWNYGGILSGLSFNFQDGFLETPEIFDRKEYFTDISEITKGKIILTKDKMLNFWNFYRNILHQGTIPFLYYDCLKDETVIMSFLEKPTSQESNGWYIISLEMRVL